MNASTPKGPPVREAERLYCIIALAHISSLAHFLKFAVSSRLKPLEHLDFAKMLGPLGKSLFNMPASHAQTTLLPDHSAGTLGSAGAAYMSVNSGLVTLRPGNLGRCFSSQSRPRLRRARKEVLMYATGNAWFFNVVPWHFCALLYSAQI